jgi:hypothetical protein
MMYGSRGCTGRPGALDCQNSILLVPAWSTPEECKFASTDIVNCDTNDPKVNRRGCASPFAAPPVLNTTLNLGWALVFEDPLTRGVWLGKSIPTLAARDRPLIV